MIRSCLLWGGGDDEDYVKSEIFVQLGNFKQGSTILEYWKCIEHALGWWTSDLLRKKNMEVMMGKNSGLALIHPNEAGVLGVACPIIQYPGLPTGHRRSNCRSPVEGVLPSASPT